MWAGLAPTTRVGVSVVQLYSLEITNTSFVRMSIISLIGSSNQSEVEENLANLASSCATLFASLLQCSNLVTIKSHA